VVALAFACTPVALLAMVARDRAAHLEQSLTISAAYDQALNLATIDALTDLVNRRAWTEAVARAAIRHAAAPIDQPVTVLMADVDSLKNVNDSFGHDAGDELIRAAASVLRLAAPEGAIVARLGGDEFGILVTGRCDADALADTVRLHAALHPTVRGCAVSLSIGTASCPPFDAVEDAVTEADLRMAGDKAVRRIERRHASSDHRLRFGDIPFTSQPAFPAIVHNAPDGLRN
jgi:diguanylate cyclase (GGDEF)-like protein